MQLVARQDGQVQGYRVLRGGQHVQSEVLLLRPGEELTYDIVSPEGEVNVQAQGLFSADGKSCGLGPLSLRAPP